MNDRLRRDCQFAAIILAIAMAVCFVIQYLTISAFNEELHVSNGPSDDKDCSAIIVPRGDKTSSWYKQDSGLTGQIFDATVANETSDLVSSWTMTINIADSCYLNQFWNGQVEIHQHASEGQEIVQTLDLADYDVASLEVDFMMEGSDLLIPLESGDYIVYHPTAEFSEVPLDSAAQTVVGMIFYYNDSVDLADYHVEYYLHRSFTEGLGFILLVILGVLLLLVLFTYLVVQQAYRQAENELELRKSGLSCMSEIYAVIYLIDLKADSIVPVGVDKEADKLRPKDLSPNDQLRNLFNTDAEAAYQGIACDFADLDTIRERMEDRNSIVFEYESRIYGWCRIRFIAMDRDEGGILEKVLFTIEQINEEKQELGAMLDQMNEARSETEEQGALLENMSQELKGFLDEMIETNELILSESNEEIIRKHARDVRDTGAKLRSIMGNAVDYSRITAGKVEVAPIEYSLKALVLGAQRSAREMLDDEEVAVEVEMAQSLPDGLRGDEPKLRQAIANMLIAAAGIEGATSVKLSVYGKAVDSETLHLLVSVVATRKDDMTRDPKVNPCDEEGCPANEEMGGVGIILARVLILLMGSQLNIADAYGGGKNLYFEIEQQIVDGTPVSMLADDDGQGAR